MGQNHNVRLFLTSLACCVLACTITCLHPRPAQADDHYLFSYFKGNGEDGLHLAHSTDGLHWKSLHNDQSFLTPTVDKDRLMRDPSIVQGPDGVFHLVWTTGWHDRGIGVAHSSDLIHWSEQKRIGVMDHQPKCRNCWAPEIFYDGATEQYLIYWASTIEGEFPETSGTCEDKLNHRIYYVTTKDFESYSDTKLFFDPGFAVIDSFLTHHDGKYFLVTKNETRFPEPKKHLFIAVAAQAAGPYKPAGQPFSPDWVEGPAVLKVGDHFLAYFDEYTRGHYKALRTSDFSQWHELDTAMTYPKGMRHGTAFAVKAQIAEQLLALASEPRVNPRQASIQVSSESKTISEDLFGIFFEDINYAADGGLYAELVQNRSFEYSRADSRNWNNLTAWETIQRGEAKVEVTTSENAPVHPNNPHYAVVNVSEVGAGAGVANEGFDGISLEAGAKYDVSLFARNLAGSPNRFTVRIERPNGDVIAETSLAEIHDQWTRLSGTLTAKHTVTDGQLVVLAEAAGSVAIDMVSLFPQNTFRNRTNGLRADVAQVIADLQPKFIRFPGGCLAHGDGLENMYRWKDTIGPVETRRAQRNIWRYHQTMGLGYYEYFQFCEDIGAEPLPVVPAGVCCQNSGSYLNLVPRGQQGIPLDAMDEYVQEVLDLIEWANGPSDSPWGSKRAEAGHPEPFALKYLGVGNEDAITPVFRERFKMIHDAVRAKYPEIVVIGTTGWATEGADFEQGWKFAEELNLQMVDEHGYKPPAWFWENVGRFDKFDRQQSHVYVGEYAAHDQGRANTLRSAIAEAAYMTGLERNGDLIRLASYAPLLAKQGHTQWRPDLIYFDNVSITPSLNYYVQQLFSANQGDVSFAAKVTLGEPESELALPTRDNGVYLGTWATQACFDDVQVSVDDKRIVHDAFEQNADAWRSVAGRWSWADGTYCQTGRNEPALTHVAFQTDAPEYTVAVRAKKTGGNEGFLIGFGVVDSDNYYWWNLGGWGNTQHAIERAVDGNRSVQEGVARGTIELNRWYNIKIHVTAERIRCYLDEQLIHDIAIRPAQRIPDLAASVVRDTASGHIIVKFVSKAKEPIHASLDLTALGVPVTQATQTVLTGDPMAENRFGQTPEVLPETTKVPASAQFQLTLPPSSLTILRLQ